MTDKQAGPVAVRPNVLAGQSDANTFHTQGRPGTAGTPYRGTGGGSPAPRWQIPLPRLSARAFLALVLLVVFVVLYVLSGTP
jgi:hypothetical protein